MKRDELERKLLLAESGELHEGEGRELEVLLAAEPDALALRDANRRVVAVARAALPAPVPSVVVRQHIREAAARRKAPALIFPTVWLRGLAYAASLVLAVGTWMWLGTGGESGGQPADRIAQVHAIVSMARTESDGTASAATQAEGGDADAKLRALAQDLLSMEGLALDDAAPDDSGAFDAVTPGEGLSPTVLQPRSIPALAARTYG